MAMYNTGLLIGRAFALANAPSTELRQAVSELRTLADGDVMALRLAQARFREFLGQRPGSLEDRRALRLLDAALADPAEAPDRAVITERPGALCR